MTLFEQLQEVHKCPQMLIAISQLPDIDVTPRTKSEACSSQLTAALDPVLKGTNFPITHP